MKPIKVYGHYGTHTASLTPIPEGFKLETESGFCRFGSAAGGGLSFVDPSGGPFIHVGDKIADIVRGLESEAVIKRIDSTEEGIILVTE
jgi:hypothetical protein